MTACCLARAEEAKLTSMTNNPGILPFKLGTSKVRQSDHVFLHFIDLDIIQNCISELDSQIQTLDALVKELRHDYRFRFTVLHDYTSDRFNSIADKYNSISKHRIKRALINGLGSIIRSITGNLDQNDAKKYNSAIELLQKNQAEIAHHTNKAITLNNLFLENYNNTISILINNQNKINIKISEIIRQVNTSQQEFFDFVKIDSLYKLLEINLQTIFETLSNLEIAISFSTKHISNYNMISFSNLEYFIQVLNKHYKPEQLITSDVTESRLYYKFLDVGSYFSDNKLVFVISIPIMYKASFIYYHLFPIPSSNNTILIPPKSYLVMNDNAYQYLEEPCIVLEKDIYYCHEDTLKSNIDKNPDCIYTLIKSQKLLPSCQFRPVKIDGVIFEKINDGCYILNCQNSTKFHLQCVHDEYVMINGSYLLELPENCTASTENASFTNQRNVINGIPIKLLSFNMDDVKSQKHLEPLKIDNIQLKQLHKIIGLIEREQQPFHLESQITETHLYWTTPLYTILFIAAIYFLYTKLKNRRMNAATDTEVQAEPVTSQPVELFSRPFFRNS